MVAVFTQFRDEPVIVGHLLVFVFEHLLIGILHFLGHIHLSRFCLGLLLFGFGFRTSSLPTPCKESTGTATKQKSQDSDDCKLLRQSLKNGI